MGCFAFLKRKKEKKMEKKKRAIADRATCNRLSTKMTNTGNLSFGVDFGIRPPTPFVGLTPRLGPIHMFKKERHQTTVASRTALLAEKMHVARQNADRRTEVLLKKERSEVLSLIEIDEVGDVTSREEGHRFPFPSSA